MNLCISMLHTRMLFSCLVDADYRFIRKKLQKPLKFEAAQYLNRL